MISSKINGEDEFKRATREAQRVSRPVKANYEEVVSLKCGPTAVISHDVFEKRYKEELSKLKDEDFKRKEPVKKPTKIITRKKKSKTLATATPTHTLF
jgi:hypothetical protein